MKKEEEKERVMLAMSTKKRVSFVCPSTRQPPSVDLPFSAYTLLPYLTATLYDCLRVCLPRLRASDPWREDNCYDISWHEVIPKCWCLRLPGVDKPAGLPHVLVHQAPRT